MGSWGHGVFESDSSRDLVADIVEDHAAEIEESLEEFSQKNSYEELNEYILVLVTVIEAIYVKTGSAPPEEKTIKIWKNKYLKAFDVWGVKKLIYLEDIYERRKVINNCFDSLRLHSNEFYSDDEENT